MEANDSTEKRTNEVYKMGVIDWVRWAFDLIVFFAERWDEIPKPRSRKESSGGVDANKGTATIPLDSGGISPNDTGTSVS